MYFMFEEDKRIQNRAKFRDIQSNGYVDFSLEEIPAVNDVTVLFMLGNGDSIYPDLIETPVFLISERLKDVIEPYDPDVIYRRVVLNQTKESLQHNYFILLTDKIECLHSEAEFYPNGEQKKIVLDRECIGIRRIFRVRGLQIPKVVIHADVSESILRRDFNGIVFHSIESR